MSTKHTKDVTDYDDISHSDQNTNIKIFDVNQIYEIDNSNIYGVCFCDCCCKCEDRGKHASNTCYYKTKESKIEYCILDKKRWNELDQVNQLFSCLDDLQMMEADIRKHSEYSSSTSLSIQHVMELLDLSNTFFKFFAMIAL